MSRSSAEPIVTIELNPDEQRVYDRLRAALVEPGHGGQSGVRDLLLLLPDLAVLLIRLLRDDRVPRGAKFVGLLGIGYLMAPVDFVPVLFFGPLGLVDDLIIVGAALSHLIDRVHPDIVRAHWPGRGDALEAVQRVTNWTSTQVGARIDRLLWRGWSKF